MHRTIGLSILLSLSLAACAASGTGGPASVSPSGAPSLAASGLAPDHLEVEQALTGEWDTRPFATDEYGGTQFDFHLTFYYEQGVPFVVMTGWDPSKGPMPEDGDHGPYQVLPDHALGITNFDHPEITTLYAYRLRGDSLVMSWLANDPDAPPEDVGGPFTMIYLFRVP